MLTDTKSYRINPEEVLPFHNGVDYCVGSGRMGLALQQAYQEQLALVQREIGFKHIRGHGLFSDDMAIFQASRDDSGRLSVVYNFTYLDMVMDSYIRLHIEPFLELGFMPAKLASGSQTIFYWKGHTTPPSDYTAWAQLITATLEHLMERYGRDRVVDWPVEVWNEPNLAGFWQDADQAAYFKLFAVSFRAIKAVDSRFKVGGPAVCGGSDEIWIRAFLDFCQTNRLNPDFITRHHYNTDVPETSGHYGYANLTEAAIGLANLHTTRTIVDAYPAYKGLPIHLTEFNTSYIPNCPLHDSIRNAAYLAQQLSRLGDDHVSYSYWTFGDIFEENGVPFTPFHGGFGLVANGCIPKPTFWVFRFYKLLQGAKLLHRAADSLFMRRSDDCYCGIVWNLSLQGPAAPASLHFEIPLSQSSEYCLLTQTVDEHHANPLKVWHDLGEPASLSATQLQLLRQTAVPGIRTRTLQPERGPLQLEFSLGSNAVIYFELTPVRLKPDPGYDYDRAVAGRGRDLTVANGSQT
ncbi:xylan 1,4-beta-xylosidase [Oscillospiraceae bacterium HV4-5-C5C]|nr:xylan 1,4-beta-xylosidase [Oscillospiraceae bacterium HV4-5-C5C]